VSARVRRADPGAERGFVLIGVIMFVLALTILGLSLFGLSTFEAEFLERSIVRTQAFYDASGGLERARWVLARYGTLQSVQDPRFYSDGVVYARAWYADNAADSAGWINWGGPRRVRVRVLAVRTAASTDPRPNTERCMVEREFDPVRLRNLYSNVLTTPGSIVVETSPPWAGANPSYEGLYLQGAIGVAAGSDTSWTGYTPGAYLLNVSALPAPDVAGFLARWAGSSQGAVQNSGGNYFLNTGARYLTGSNDPPQPGYSVYNFNDPKISLRVSGTVLWMLPQGAFFYQKVEVKGGPDDRLVIVAGRSAVGNFPGFGVSTGIHFLGGVESAVPLILVSDGVIAFEQRNNPSPTPGDGYTIDYLSAFAAGIYLSGPQRPQWVRLLHSLNVAYQDGAILDPLAEAGLLPNIPPGQNRQLEPLAGSWRLVPETTPPN
jgi:hypothetical protein